MTDLQRASEAAALWDALLTAHNNGRGNPAYILERALQAERDAVVAWLRAEADWQAGCRDGAQSAALSLAADVIERNDHRSANHAE